MAEHHDVPEVLTICRWFGLQTTEYRILQETVQIMQRSLFKMAAFQVPLESIRRESVTIRTFSKLALAAFLVPFVVAMIVFASGHNDPGPTAVSIFYLALSVPGLIAFFLSRKETVLLVAEGVQMPFFRTRKTAEAIRRFLAAIHRAKLQVIERKIKNVSSMVQIEDMFRRLTFYVDKRIISHSEMEEFTAILNDAKLQAT
jgi:hypothetical protein